VLYDKEKHVITFLDSDAYIPKEFVNYYGGSMSKIYNMASEKHKSSNIELNPQINKGKVVSNRKNLNLDSNNNKSYYYDSNKPSPNRNFYPNVGYKHGDVIDEKKEDENDENIIKNVCDIKNKNENEIKKKEEDIFYTDRGGDFFIKNLKTNKYVNMRDYLSKLT
jgi:hypothetical protein